MTNQSSSRVFFIIFLASLFLGLGLFCDHLPKMIENYMKKTIDLATNDMIKQFWSKPPIVFPSYYWVYNVTNPNEFLLGEKPSVEKVGPFYFTSSMEKRIIDISKNNYRITYNSTRIYFPVNETTVGAGFDKPLNAINVILPSILDAVSEKVRFMDEQQGQMLARTSLKMAEKFNETLIMRTTAREILLGRKSVFLQKAMKLAAAFSEDATAPGMREDGLFGLITAQNGTLSGPLETYTGYGETVESLGNIISVQGKQRSPYFNGSCARIQVSAGELRPFPVALNETLEMYRPELGRVLHLKPTGLRKIKEGLAIPYVFSELDFTAPLGDPKRDCYCVNGTANNYCSLNGAIEMGPVVNFAPLVFTTNVHEIDERIKSSLANWSPELVSSHVDSLPDADKTCQFLILRSLGIPIRADFTATIFIKVTRNLKAKSLSSVPEVSYVPMVTQRERIIVPDSFLAPLVHVNTLIELSKHMKVVFYVSALFLIVPLTNIYYRQASRSDNETANTTNNNNPHSNGNFAPTGFAGNSLEALASKNLNGAASGNTNNTDPNRNAFVGLQLAGQGGVAGGGAKFNNSTNPFVLPVNIGNLTPQSPDGNILPQNNFVFQQQMQQQKQQHSINQVGCATPSQLDNGKNSMLNQNLTLNKQNLSLNSNAKASGEIAQQAIYFSKLDELRNSGANAGIGQKQQQQQANSQPVSLQPRSSQQDQFGLANKGAASSLAHDLNTNKQQANSNTTNDTPNRKNSLSNALAQAATAPAGSSSHRNSLGGPAKAGSTPRGSRGAILDLQSDQLDRDQADSIQIDPGQENGWQGGGRARYKRNWFLKVYTDVVKVLADIKKSISTASQLDISETNDIHDKQLEMLAGRIDNWYGNGVGASDDATQPNSEPNTSSNGDAIASNNHIGLAPTTKAPVKREAPILEEEQQQHEAKRDDAALSSPRKSVLIDEETQTSDLNAPIEAGNLELVNGDSKANNNTNNNIDSDTSNEHNLESDLVQRKTASNMDETTAGSVSPVKSLEESALGLSVDVESTTTEVDATDKDAALQKLAQTIEKLDQPGDLVDLSSLQDQTAASEQAEASSKADESTPDAQINEQSGETTGLTEQLVDINNDDKNNNNINTNDDVAGRAIRNSNTLADLAQSNHIERDEASAANADQINVDEPADGIISQDKSEENALSKADDKRVNSDSQKQDTTNADTESQLGSGLRPDANYKQETGTNNIARQDVDADDSNRKPTLPNDGWAPVERKQELASGQLDHPSGIEQQQRNEIMPGLSALNVDGDFPKGGQLGIETPSDKFQNSHPSAIRPQAAQAS